MNVILRLAVVGLMVPAALVVACSSDEKASGPDGGVGGAKGTGGASTGGGGGVATGGGGAAAFNCDQSACQPITLAGTTFPVCCVSDTQCGVQVPMAGCLAFKIPEAGPPEKIVLDSKCPSLQIPGFGGGAATTLRGCCDMSGVCGVSTADFPSLGGIPVPSMCDTPDDLRASGVMDAGRDVPCDYLKGDGGPETTDAGSKTDAGDAGH